MLMARKKIKAPFLNQYEEREKYECVKGTKN